MEVWSGLPTHLNWPSTNRSSRRWPTRRWYWLSWTGSPTRSLPTTNWSHASGTHPNQGYAEQVAKALVTKAYTLGQLGSSADALAAYDELVARFGTHPR